MSAVSAEDVALVCVCSAVLTARGRNTSYKRELIGRNGKNTELGGSFSAPVGRGKDTCTSRAGGKVFLREFKQRNKKRGERAALLCYGQRMRAAAYRASADIELA